MTVQQGGGSSHVAADDGQAADAAGVRLYGGADRGRGTAGPNNDRSVLAAGPNRIADFQEAADALLGRVPARDGRRRRFVRPSMAATGIDVY